MDMVDSVLLKAKLLDLLEQRYQKDPGFFVNKSTISIELGITEEESFRYADYLVNNKWVTISEPQTSRWRIMITEEGKKEFERIRNVIVEAKKNIKTENKIKNSKLKIIIDPNGGTGIIAKTILEKLNVKVHGINMKHGIFNRTIEPNESSLFYLSNLVREKNYDFAAGFDCDADRVEIMTSKSLVSGNHLLALIADNILENAKNKTIEVNDATSSVVKEIAKKHNAKYIETGVGEINVVDKMYELKAPVGGEGSSSGIIIPPSRCRDGILTLVYLLKIIANNKKNINELVKSLPEYYYIKKSIKIDSKKYAKIKENLKIYYIKKNYKIKESGAGSLKIYLNDNEYIWFRVSKTESNILRVIADSPNKKKAEVIMKEALNLIKWMQIIYARNANKKWKSYEKKW